MKHLLTIILAALMIASSITSCGKTEPAETTPSETTSPETTPMETKPDETTPIETDTPETEDPWADTETMRNDKTTFNLASLTTSIGMEIRENRLYVTSLVTESGTEKISTPTAYALPSQHGSYESGGDYTDFAWVYTGYTTYNDNNGGKGYTFLFEDTAIPASYKLSVVARPDMAGPFEFSGSFTNNGTETILYKPDEIFTASVSGESAPTAWTFAKEGGMAEGYRSNQHKEKFYPGTGIYHTTLSADETVTVSNNVYHDWNQNGGIPMMYVDYGTNGIYCVLEWTNGTLTAVGEGDGSVNLSIQLADCDFETKASVGSPVATPSVYLGVYDGDVDMGSNAFKHWFLRYKAPDNMLANENEPLVQQDMQLGVDVAKYGIQQIKWDLGWWWKDEYEQNNGLLEVRNPAYLGVFGSLGVTTLSEFVQKAKEAGVNLTTYILLKDTELERDDVPTSAGENGHPEWFSYETIGGWSADLGNEECVAFYKDYLYNFFNETGVTTYRSDWEPISMISYEENRHLMEGTDVAYWNTVGFGELIDHLTDKLGYFRYESCSSGGSMKDLWTMTKASIINCDDSADFMSLHTSFYDSSYCIHPAQLQLPCNAGTYTPGNENYAGIGDYLYGFRCVLTGGVMLSNWTGPTEEDISYWPYYINNLYNNVMKPLIRYGDLYHILPRPDGIHWDGLQYIDADSEREIKGLVMLWKPTDTEGSEKTVYLRGLESETMYQLTFEDRPDQNCTKTGADLMENGLTVTIEGESGSEMIWISEAK